MDSIRVVVPRLTNENYGTWSFKLEMLMQREEVWHVISEPKPATVTVAWTKADTKAKAIIGLHIEDDQITIIRDCKNAKDAWEALRKFHDNASEVYLLKKLTSLTLSEGQNMEQHLSTFSELIQRIGASGETIPRKWQVAMLLCSLPPSYDPLTTAIELTNINELTVENVKSKLLAEAEKRKERTGNAEIDKAMKSEAIPRNRKPARVICYGCNKPGHLKRNCRLLKRTEAKRVENDNKEVRAWTIGHAEATAWYVDSGASRHMTGNKEFFDKFSTTNIGTVTLADGKKTEVMGTGNGTLICIDKEGKPISIVLSDVLYVPRLTSGLISVSSLTRKGLQVLFTGEQCIIKGKNDEVIATANNNGSLYKLHTTEKALKGLFQTHSEECIHTLHRRLGHRKNGVTEKTCKDNGIKVKEFGNSPLTPDRPFRESRRKPPAYLDEYIIGIAKSASIEPTSWQEAMNSPHHSELKEAMDAEMVSHENNTWEVTELPPEKIVIGSRLLMDLSEEPLGTILMYEDNQSCISFAQSGKISKRSKHIETKEFFVRDLIDRKEIELRYCPTEDMIADILTKALGNVKHKKFSSSLGLTNPDLTI